MKRVILLAIGLTACGQASHSGPAGSSCASATTYAGVASEIARYVGPSSMVAPSSIIKALGFSKPTADSIDRDTGTVSCSADMTATDDDAIFPIPAGLDAVPGEHPTIRVRYQLKKEAGNGRQIYAVSDVAKVAEFATYALFANDKGRVSPPQKPTLSSPTPPGIQSLIDKEEVENDHCRGGSGDSVETMRACNRRQSLLKELQDNGWCWGGADIEAEKHFVSCKPGDKDYSAGEFDAPYYSESDIAGAANGQ